MALLLGVDGRLTGVLSRGDQVKFDAHSDACHTWSALARLRQGHWGLTRQAGPRRSGIEPGSGEEPEVADIRRRQAAGEIAVTTKTGLKVQAVLTSIRHDLDRVLRMTCGNA